MPKSITVVEKFETTQPPSRLRLYVSGNQICMEDESGDTNILAELTSDGKLDLFVLTDGFVTVLDCDKDDRIKVKRES